MLDDLIREIDAHLAWRTALDRPLAESTFGRFAVDDGKLIARLRAGGQITVGKMTAIREWMARDRETTRPGQPASPSKEVAA